MAQSAVKHATTDLASDEIERLHQKVGDLECLLQLNVHILSNMCHEFRSLLTSLRGYTKQVLEERSGPINDVQRANLAVVQKNTRKLLDLASHSLPFIAEQRPRVESVDLRELWRQAVKRVGPRLAERSVTMQELIAAEEVVVIADRVRLETAFRIVLENAINCSPAGGETTAQIRQTPDGEVTVTVLVPGASLPSDLLDRIFEHNDTLAEAYPECPRLAGLALAYDLVLLHGGRLAARGIADGGALFAITLPVPVRQYDTTP